MMSGKYSIYTAEMLRHVANKGDPNKAFVTISAGA